MDADTEMSLKADTAAEAMLASMMQNVYQGTAARFTDEDVDAIRQTFKMGWLTGYKAAHVEMAELLKERREEREHDE